MTGEMRDQSQAQRDAMLHEYTICRQSVDNIDARVWQGAAIFIAAGITGLFLILTRCGAMPPAAVTLLSAEVTVLLILYWCIARRWLFYQQIFLYRMREIESALGLASNRYIDWLDEERDDRSLEKKKQDFKSDEERERFEAIRLFFKERKFHPRFSASKSLRLILGVIIVSWLIYAIAAIIGLSAATCAQTIQDHVAFEEAKTYFNVLESSVGKLTTARGQGTAFIVNSPRWTDRRIVLTAGHVIHNGDSATLDMPFTANDHVEQTKPVRFLVEIGKDTLIAKTGAGLILEKYDIAVIVLRLEDIPQQTGQSNTYFGSIKPQSFVSWNDVIPGQGLLYLGFPLGISSEVFHPVLRTARVAGSDQGRLRLLADGQFFDGSSGSPVFLDIRDPSCRLPALAGRYFVGLVTAYVPYQKFLLDAKTLQVEMVQTENSGVGYILPAPVIQALLDSLPSR